MSTVLITGGASGLGNTLVKEFLKDGYNVVFSYNNSSFNNSELDGISNSYLAVKCNLSNEDDIDNLVEKAYEKYGEVDVLINNAAIEIDKDIDLKTKEDFMKTLEVNIVAPFLLSRLVCKRMYDNKKGSVINISSNNSIDKYDPVTLEYDASKSALNSLSHNLAKAYAPYVRVNTIAPGWILTERVRSLNDELDGKLVEEERKKILLNRFASESDIANLALFLASDKSSYINDEIIRIDGGNK